MTIYKLNSSLLLNNVSKLLIQFNKSIKPGKSLQFDLGHITHIDSAGIAFLLELKSICKQKNCQISFINLSTVVSNFCQLYQVTL